MPGAGRGSGVPRRRVATSWAEPARRRRAAPWGGVKLCGELRRGVRRRWGILVRLCAAEKEGDPTVSPPGSPQGPPSIENDEPGLILARFASRFQSRRRRTRESRRATGPSGAPSASLRRGSARTATAVSGTAPWSVRQKAVGRRCARRDVATNGPPRGRSTIPAGSAGIGSVGEKK